MSKQLVVADMQGEDFLLVEDKAVIARFNERFCQQYTYFFIEFNRGFWSKLYGAYNKKQYNHVHFVSDL